MATFLSGPAVCTRVALSRTCQIAVLRANKRLAYDTQERNAQSQMVEEQARRHGGLPHVSNQAGVQVA